MSTPTRSLSWDGAGTRRWPAAIAIIALLSALVGTAPAGADDTVDVIIRETNAGSNTAENLIRRIGGTVETRFELIGGFSATIPVSALDIVLGSPAIAAATPDGSLQLQSTTDWATDPATYRTTGSMYKNAVRFIRADAYWNAGFTGAGIDVALIDSGVAPVLGMTEPGKVLNGPDLSIESQSDSFRYLDTYGHGTHMAGIIAGRDPGVTNPTNDSLTKFVGIAPGARIVNVKVAGYDGAVDVSQVLAAIDWVVQNRNSNGLNIRVLNLSFGTDSVQDSILDPLSYAVDRAWKAGIVVVVAAGNDGNVRPVRMPAANRNVIAVGSYDTADTNITSDDFLTSFTNCGTTTRKYDVVVPGRSILSLRNPGSFADDANPGAVVDGRYFKGSGTSQSAAMVSGGIALMLQHRPQLTPDQVKALIVGPGTAHLGIVPPTGCPRKTSLKLNQVLAAAIPTTLQSNPAATGLGTLEASRGTDHLTEDGVVLAGEMDIFGQPFSTATWAPLAATGSSWSNGVWNGRSWSGSSWSGSSWSGSSWSGSSWSGSSWSGRSWSNSTWSGRSWSGSSWSGSSWSGRSWSGSSWSGSSWSGQRWE